MKRAYTHKKSGKKLLTYLKEREPHASVKAIKRAIDAGRCRVNGKIELYSTRRLLAHDKVEIEVGGDPQPPSSLAQGCYRAGCEGGRPPILYEDEELLIVDKPPGVVSENSHLNRLFPNYLGKLMLVHRLDKETSGLLILAKNPQTFLAMRHLFAQQAVEKEYLAIVFKQVSQTSGKIESFLAKESSPHASQGECFIKSVPPHRGKHAITLWSRLAQGPDSSLLLLKPLTGRTHQLRVHLSEQGHPIVGDIKYSHRFLQTPHPRRHLLHACRIRMTHPSSQKTIELTQPPPQDFIATLQALEIFIDIPLIINKLHC